MKNKNNGTFAEKVPLKKYITLFSAVMTAYAFIENKFMLCVRRERLGDGLKIVQVSDLHKKKYGHGNEKICRKIKRENPDLIFITGDVVSRTETDFSAVGLMLEKLCGIAPVYLIFGNHEQSLPCGMKRDFIKSVKKSGAVILRNRSVCKEIKNRKIYICGLNEKYTTYRRKNSYRNLDVISCGDMENLLGKCPDGETLLLAHNPFFCGAYAEWGADYTFSGHVHGGAVRLFGRGILSPERKFFPQFSKGVYRVGKMFLLVSGGLGKLRLFNPPEIVAYDIPLKPEKRKENQEYSAHPREITAER